MNSPNGPCLMASCEPHSGHCLFEHDRAAATARFGDLARSLAFGITGAGEELTEATALERHRLPHFSQVSSAYGFSVRQRLRRSPHRAGLASSRVFLHSG